ncbi:bark storage protein A-like [Magnolia sinica]|uniref:bark storage protein A-like n=1 Tax=Magnolia sinica TaxID=86752 RepID=UPI00265B0CCF|nr:bark storage protein A-like [Magnolia sinica]
MGASRALFLVLIVLMCCNLEGCEGAFTKAVVKMLNKVNRAGPYVGLVTPTSSDLYTLLGSSSFRPSDAFKYIDYSGRRFHIGSIEGKKVIAAMTGKGMINAATVAQLLLTLFDVRALLHYGMAGNANPDLNTGDVTIPEFWAHTGLWNWQRYGDGPDDELSLEPDGAFTREIGSLNFADFNNKTDKEDTPENILNSVWFQPEDIFPTDGIPESSEQKFWVAVDHLLFDLSKKLEASEYIPSILK